MFDVMWLSGGRDKPVSEKQVPKYIQVKDEIISWVKSGKYPTGAQLPTEMELAEMFNVSRQTVRQSLSDLVRDQLLSRVQGRGTFVSGPVASDRVNVDYTPTQSKIIGVVTTYISDYIFPEIIRGLENQLSALGYSLLLLNTQNNFELERRALQRIMDTNVTGLIVEPTKSAIDNPNLDMYLALMAQKVPMVMLHASYLELDVSTVCINDIQAESELTQMVIDYGHRIIAGIFKEDDIQGKLRMRGYIHTLQENELDVYPEFIRRYSTENLDEVIRALIETIESTSQERRPTAIVCYNDDLAVKLIDELKAREIQVPYQISVVGFDNSQYAQLCTPKLTTVEHPKFKMGITVANLIVDEIDDIRGGRMKQNRDITLNCEIVLRESLRKLR